MKSLLRISAVALLVFAGFIGAVSEPSEGCTSWMATMLLSKGIGAVLLVSGVALFNHWCDTDPVMRCLKRDVDGC